MAIDFSTLNFESFQRLAEDTSLSQYEKIGFPDNYRRGFEDAIFKDICNKLPVLRGTGKTVLDIGPGCSNLAHKLIEHCRQREHRLLLVDSRQMLAHLPDAPFVLKIAGMFPNTSAQIFDAAPEGIDVIVCYSVLQYLFMDTDPWAALDRMLELLKPGGEILLGDIPNLSMRNRFFSSVRGIASHRQFTGQDNPAPMPMETPDPNKIDDTVVLSILARMRVAGADAFVLPQATELPMSNRREDILIRKP